MSIHISANQGEIADFVLLPGDPLRAKYVADHYLEDVKCYNEVRSMFGYTGTYKGVRVSVQGTGMGAPSASIYIHELIKDYSVKKLIRIGSAGSMQPDVHVKDVVFALSASTNAAVNNRKFSGGDFAACADFELLMKACDVAKQLHIPIKAGNMLSSDIFYEDSREAYNIWADHGVLCVEMEANALYTIAAKFGVKALSICTISDSLVTHETSSALERQNSFHDMMRIALECSQ